MATRRHTPGDGDSTWARAKPLFLAAVLTVLTIVGLQLLVELKSLLLLLFVSLVLAAAMSRPAAMLERRGIPRGLAVAFVQLVTLGVLFVIGYIVLPPLLDEIASFGKRVPHYVDRFQGLRRDYAKLQASYPELGSFDSEVSKLADRFGSVVGSRLIDLPLGIASLLYKALTVLAFSTLIVMRRERIVRSFMPLVAPHRREHTEAIIETIWERIGAYVRAKLIVMTVVGVLMYLSLLALHVPFAVPLAVIVAFGEIIPQIGPWIGRVPLLAVAAFEGPTTLGLTFLASFVLENLKAYVISPRVEGEQLKLDPLLVLVAVLAGATLLGPAGALVSVPFAAMLQVLYDEILVPWRKAQIGEEEEEPVSAAP
jgi:predicted PurR-regulated permease PerM